MDTEMTDTPETNGAEVLPKPEDMSVRPLDDQPDALRYGENVESTMLTFDEAVAVVREAAEDDGARTDQTVEDLNRWTFAVLADSTTVLVASDKRIIPLRHTAFGHLCARAKAPPGYLRSLPARYSVPDLNWGIFNKSEGSAKLRMAGDEARAIVSARYTAFDDSVVLPAVRESLVACGLLDSTSVRAVGTGLTTLVRIAIPGDAVSIPGTDEIVEISLDVTNGEVGNRAVGLAPSVWLRHKRASARRTFARFRHLGDINRLAAEFKETIPEALAEARKLRAQIATSVDKIIKDVAEEADRLRAMGLSIAEARDVLRGLAKSAGIELAQDTAEWEGPLSTLESVSAYEMFVQVALLGEGRSIDRRLELEEVAAKYLARAVKS